MRANHLETALVFGLALAFVGATALWPKVMLFVILGTLSLITVVLLTNAFLDEASRDR